MILLLGSFVFAAGPRVILVGASWSDPIVARMRDELGVLGFDVEIIVGGATTTDLATLARAHGAAAAARVDAVSAAIDLWVDPTSEPGTVADLHLDGPGDPGLLALRAVELLRGRLIHAAPAPTADGAPAPDAGPPPQPPAASPAARPIVGPMPIAAAPPARAAGSFALFVAPAAMLSPGGLPPVPHVHVAAEWFPVDRVGVELLTFLPTVPATVTAPEGSVALRILELGAGIHGTLTDPGADLSFGVGLGLNAMLLLFDGEAAPPFVADHGSRWLASPYASIRAAYRLYPRLALRADVLTTLARPEPVIRIAGREVASFGQPTLFLSLGIEVRP
jgi:hypothetical protein